jgi:guanosine-3',5'-bis(diphosphate) 3'-pyrophosphohydrolase
VRIGRKKGSGGLLFFARLVLKLKIDTNRREWRANNANREGVRRSSLLTPHTSQILERAGRRRMDRYVRLLKAVAFAAEKHKDQRRKDVNAYPYINHPIAVATLLAEEGHVTDEELLLAAILHDTVEDTETSFAELEAHFGKRVAGIVREVTDDKTLRKEVRKRLQEEHAPHASPRAKQLRVADKICNIRDLVGSPPAGWSMERKEDYLLWTRRVVAGCRGVNEALDIAYDEALRATAKHLGVTIG